MVTNASNCVCFYRTGDGHLVASGGGITITSMGEEDGFIKRSFTIQPAGYGDDLKSRKDIEGKLRVKKSW